MSKIILYNYFRSSTSYRVRIALNLKNIEYVYQPVHLINNGGEQFSSAYQALNPMSEVPTLEHDGLALGQSVAIIEYLEEQFPNPSLFPKDIQKRGKIRQFCENINSFLHPLSNLKVLKYLEQTHGYDQKQKEEWINHWYQKGLLASETWLQKNMGHYCFGDQVTVADCFLVPLVFTSERFNVDLTPYKNILNVNERCLKLEAFKHAHPFRQIDTPAELKIT
ncbi:MAG: maleylacetoacetate isomerase [Bdellovibrionaceae bacterium]|nr:maleylacetoacetate isomerase [Pseudobdellovibrionaceae bacterium]